MINGSALSRGCISEGTNGAAKPHSPPFSPCLGEETESSRRENASLDRETNTLAFFAA